MPHYQVITSGKVGKQTLTSVAVRVSKRTNHYQTIYSANCPHRHLRRGSQRRRIISFGRERAASGSGGKDNPELIRYNDGSDSIKGIPTC